MELDVRPVRIEMRRVMGALLLGAGVGTIVLGVGGRLAMRAIALITNAPARWTFGGTFTVIFLGAVSGAAGAVLHMVARAIGAGLAPSRPWVTHTVFATLLGLVTWRGLHPVQPLAAALFVPLVAAYAVFFEAAERRR